MLGKRTIQIVRWKTVKIYIFLEEENVGFHNEL